MAYYRAAGDIPPKRHTQHRREGGELYYEELMGEEGFSSDSSLLYHRNIPSTVSASRVWEVQDQSTTPNHPLTPRHLKLHELFDDATTQAADVVTGRATGRNTRDSITLFKSVGLALEDVALGGKVLQLAREQSVGREITF